MMAVLARVLHKSAPMNRCRVGASLKATVNDVIGIAQDTIMNAAYVQVRSAFQGATLGVVFGVAVCGIFGAALGCSLGTACGAAAAAAA